MIDVVWTSRESIGDDAADIEIVQKGQHYVSLRVRRVPQYDDRGAAIPGDILGYSARVYDGTWTCDSMHSTKAEAQAACIEMLHAVLAMRGKP